mmetsp:Transcript_38265/g.71771  ORF Transcript_38265/g.71771 Transcript_38265/m.71771 type:complete len:83 (+) Transcript_38265:1425-1673(+)
MPFFSVSRCWTLTTQGFISTICVAYTKSQLTGGLQGLHLRLKIFVSTCLAPMRAPDHFSLVCGNHVKHQLPTLAELNDREDL